MSGARFTRFLHWGLVLLVTFVVSYPRNVIQPVEQPHRALALIQQPGLKSLYLPIGSKEVTRAPSIFGVETNSFDQSRVSELKTLNTYWVRRFMVDWSKIEPLRTDPPTYNWGAVDEAGLLAVAASKVTPVITVKFTPSWAQKYSGVTCGPPAADYLDEFAQFLQAVVARYSRHPYNARYWEIGNEVEVVHTIDNPDSIYGCWGAAKEQYYGGGYYAQMLKLAYPAMKTADPQAQILIGGLLLDCDPTHPPVGKNCKSSRYLEGILANGGGPYFDIVSYHSYAYYVPGKIWEDTPNWSARGGVFEGKISYLREVLAEYQVDKPLMLTEGSLVCSEATAGCNPIGDEFKELQGDYVYWVYLRGWAENLAGVFWYTLEDSEWRSSGLKKNGVPNPAYYAYQYLSGTLQDAQLVGPVTGYSGLLGYKFKLPDKNLWIVWAPDHADQLIPLPDNVSSIRDEYGNAMPLSSQVTVNHPLIIEFAP